MAKTMKSLDEVPPNERADWFVRLGEALDDGRISLEQAAYLEFGPDPIYGWMASQDSQMVPARPQLI